MICATCRGPWHVGAPHSCVWFGGRNPTAPTSPLPYRVCRVDGGVPDTDDAVTVRAPTPRDAALLYARTRLNDEGDLTDSDPEVVAVHADQGWIRFLVWAELTVTYGATEVPHA